ncbi:MAG: M56 family metallopeptidase [Gemmatimonadales bacterium]|jgi:beta-lactamase regulating signal transducer with metallopeptidase domain
MNGAVGFADLVVRPTIVLVLAGVVALALHRRSAASRHLVWSAALCAVLAIPLLGRTVPGLDVPVGDAVTRTVESWPLPFRFGSPTPPDELGNPTSSDEASSNAGETSGGIPWRALWVVGIAASLAVLIMRYVALRSIERAAAPAGDTPLAARLAAARRRLSIERPVRLLLGEPDAMPMTWGMRVPRILLPAAAAEWPEAQTEAVLLHELAHVKRGDVALQRFAELARAVFWFNPLAWLATRRMLTEREHACDDAVLATGVRGSEYAHQLLAMAHSLRTARGSAYALPMARRSQMTGRLLAILDEGRARWAPRGAAPPLAIGLAVLVALAATTVRPVASAQTAASATPVASAAPAATGELTSPAGSGGAAATPDTVGCWHPIGPDSNHNKNEDPGVITASWKTRRCVGGLEITGRAVLSADTSGFASLSPGGQVSIGEKEGDYWRRIGIVGRADGQLELYGRFGEERASYEQVDGWLRANLRPMLRLTGVELEVAGGP